MAKALSTFAAFSARASIFGSGKQPGAIVNIYSTVSVYVKRVHNGYIIQYMVD